MSERRGFTYDGDPVRDLERVLEHDMPRIIAVITADAPLTPEVLTSIDPILGGVAAERRETALQWPDSDSQIQLESDSPIGALIGPDSDKDFALPIVSHGSHAYNNFYAILAAEHEEPSESAMFETFARNKQSIYGTKPYLVRTHELFPDFMDALQRSVKNLGMQRYHQHLLGGIVDPENYNPALTTASRLAYVTMVRLMRADDLRIQYAMLGLPTQDMPLIDDPVAELHQ